MSVRGPAAPPRLGKYQILHTLGAGAMGVVYLAHDPSIDRKVAIKTIRKDLLDPRSSAEITARFRREAMAVGRLSHPGIVAVYDYGEDEQTAFIVMEYAPGDDLARVLAQRPLSFDEVVTVMAQLLEALAYAHDAGVVHRDIKPSNLIISGRVKIMDFGIAQVGAASALTQAGTTMGTPMYMAPEQYMGTGVDHRADLFAAGVLLHEILLGAVPFDGESVAEIAYKVCHVNPAPPSARRPDLGPLVDDVVARALSKSREGRFSSAYEMRSAVMSALAPLDVTSRLPLGSTPEITRSAALASGVRAAGGTGELRLSTEMSAVVQVTGAPAPVVAAPPSLTVNVAPDVLERVTQALASHVGPIARVIVKKAAADAPSYRDLCLRVAQRLATEDERARFLRQVGVSP